MRKPQALLKTVQGSSVTAFAQRRKGQAKGAAGQPGLPRARLEGAGASLKRENRKGSYKRVEVFLGVEAAIALRQLMRDGRSARQVIEALLLAERQRRKEED